MVRHPATPPKSLMSPGRWPLSTNEEARRSSVTSWPLAPRSPAASLSRFFPRTWPPHSHHLGLSLLVWFTLLVWFMPPFSDHMTRHTESVQTGNWFHSRVQTQPTVFAFARGDSQTELPHRPSLPARRDSDPRTNVRRQTLQCPYEAVNGGRHPLSAIVPSNKAKFTKSQTR